MDEERLLLFLIAESVLIVLGFAVASLVSPPDIYSQLIATTTILVVTLPLSYWWTYRRA